MNALLPLPYEWNPLLDRYRLRSRRYARPNASGAHLIRRKGQSLEFRDFAPYTPGDDIRHVDWTASFRHSLGEDLLIKNFAAEEQMTLAISVDIRESMSLPQPMSKLQIALWLAEAVTRIALASGDRVVLHPLFGPKLPLLSLGGPGRAGRVRETLQAWAGRQGEGEHSNLAALRGLLPPTSVWMILTDVYFTAGSPSAGSPAAGSPAAGSPAAGPPVRELAHQIDSVRRGHRWVMLVDLDSWPNEKAALGIGNRKIEGPGLPQHGRRVDISRRTLREIETRIHDHKARFREVVDGAGLDWLTWSWPATAKPDPAGFFKDRFFHDPVIRRLFMKET